jgi:hypothetical protein
MSKYRSVVVALLCTVVLSSCALLPFGHRGTLYDDSFQKADAQMTEIAAAVNSHDKAALKAMFSSRALEKATDFDAGLEYFLAFFPNGGLTWKLETVGSEVDSSYGAKTELLNAHYTVTADGVDYSLFFADFTVNDAYDSDNVGIYALGVTPWVDGGASGAADAFATWAGSMSIDESSLNAYAGVYFPPDTSQLSIQKMNRVLFILNNVGRNGDWLRGLFSVYAQREYDTQLDNELDELFAYFPAHSVELKDDPKGVPVVRESTDNGGETRLLISSHRVLAGGAYCWFSFAYFTDNSMNPENLGFYAMGVAPWTASGDSAAEKALFAWLDTFDVDASVPPGIFISQ